jgi:hypothetical protein
LSNEGLTGSRCTPKCINAHASMSSRQSARMTNTSIRTPRTTAAVNHGSVFSQNSDRALRESMEISSAEREFFKADMELSKAEESEGRLEAAWIRSVAITAIALLRLLGARIGVLILAPRRVAHLNQTQSRDAPSKLRLGGVSQCQPLHAPRPTHRAHSRRNLSPPALHVISAKSLDLGKAGTEGTEAPRERGTRNPWLEVERKSLALWKLRGNCCFLRKMRPTPTATC